MHRSSLSLAKLICLTVIAFFSILKIQAQNASDMPLAKTYQGTVWKTTPELNSAISGERERNAVLMNLPDLQETDKATYTAYDRLMELILQDISSGSPLEEIAVHDFQKVVADAPNDPALKSFDQGMLRHYFNQLIEIMTQQPVPVPVAAPSGL